MQFQQSAIDYLNNIFCGNNKRNISRRFSKIAEKQYMEVAQITKECNFGQKTTVCNKANKEVE